jgi:hypothetical protein
MVLGTQIGGVESTGIVLLLVPGLEDWAEGFHVFCSRRWRLCFLALHGSKKERDHRVWSGLHLNDVQFADRERERESCSERSVACTYQKWLRRSLGHR